MASPVTMRAALVQLLGEIGSSARAVRHSAHSAMKTSQELASFAGRQADETASSTIAAEVEGSAGMNEGSGAAAPQLADIARALDGPSERLDHSSAASSI